MSKGTGMDWYGPAVQKKIDAKIKKRIKAGCIFLRSKLRKESSRKQPTRGTGLNKRGLYPSLPGEPPKRVTGRHIKSIEWETQTFDVPESGRKVTIGRVGSNYKVSKWLELGTKKMQRRPWLTLGWQKYRTQIGRIIELGTLPPETKDPLTKGQRRKVSNL